MTLIFFRPQLARQARASTGKAPVWLVAIALVLVGVGAGLPEHFARIRGRLKLDPSSFDQIQLGMTEPQVEAILGAPPGDYSAHRNVYTRETSEGAPATSAAVEQCWSSDRGMIAVGLDDRGQVIHKRCRHAQRDPGPWDRGLEHLRDSFRHLRDPFGRE